RLGGELESIIPIPVVGYVASAIGPADDALACRRKASTGELAEIAFRDRANFLVFSTISRVGAAYALSIHCELIGAAPDPPIRVWDQTFTANGPDGLFEAVHGAATWIRTTAGESTTEISEHNRLPQDITSSNWEALELFDEAQKMSRRGNSAAAL